MSITSSMFSSRIHMKNVPKYLKSILKFVLFKFLLNNVVNLSDAASVEIILVLPLCWNKWGPRIDVIRCNKKWIRWRLMPTIIVNVMKSLLLKMIISQKSYNNITIWLIVYITSILANLAFINLPCGWHHYFPMDWNQIQLRGQLEK